jgi:hypothetical protein
MNKTIGNLILMTLICVAVFIVFMAIRPAKAQWTPWGWQHSWQLTARCAAAARDQRFSFFPRPAWGRGWIREN